MSDPQHSGMQQQQAWGAPSSNNSLMPYHRPPPPPAPYSNTHPVLGTGDRPHMSVNARPPIRPPVENPPFATQQLSAPAPLYHSVHQYHSSGWGVPVTAQGSAAAQWEPARQAPNFTVPGLHQNTWGTVNDSASSWSTIQQSINRLHTQENSMLNKRPPIPPPPPPPMHQGNTPMNFSNSGAPPPHWSQQDPTKANAHGIVHQHLPNFGAVSARQQNIGIPYQTAPSATHQSNLGYSQTYMAAHVQQQNLSQPISFQRPPIHAIQNVPPSTQTQQSASHAVVPPAPLQVPAGSTDVSVQKQPPPEVSKKSKNRRKRKRQDRKNQVTKEETQAPAVAATATVIETASDANSVSPTGGQFSDPVDNEMEQELDILDFLINQCDSTSSDVPDETLFQNLELCCEKLKKLEKGGNCSLPILKVAQKARLTQRAQEIMASHTQGKNIVAALVEPSNETMQKTQANVVGHSDTFSLLPAQVEPYAQKASVPDHPFTGYSHNVEFAVENDSKGTLEVSAPRKSASKALEEAKAKLRLAKLHMSLAAKKKALQEAKAKSGQSVDPINALLKGGLDCFFIEQIASSGPASKIRFLDALLDDDLIYDMEEKHSSDMSMDDDSSDEIRISVDDPPLNPVYEDLPVLRDEPSLLQRVAELQNLTLSKLKDFESGTKLQRLDKAGLTSLLRDTVDKTMEETNNVANLEATSSLGSSKESRASTRALLQKRKEEALRSRAVAHHKNVISKQQRMIRKQLVETEQIDQSIRVIDEEVLVLSNQKCPELRGKIRTLEGRKHVLDDMLSGYLAELMSLRKELHTNKQQCQESSGWISSSI